MPRPQRTRKIRTCSLPYSAFKPTGVYGRDLVRITMSLDEYEAICLVDGEGLYQETAAESMGVSRQTLGNILLSARKKLAEMLIEGRMIVIEGGNVCCCRNGNHFSCCSGHHSGGERPYPHSEEAGTSDRTPETEEHDDTPIS